jgi:serine protease inhibitor
MKSILKYALPLCFIPAFVFTNGAEGQQENIPASQQSALLARADEIVTRMSEIRTQYKFSENQKNYDLTALKETSKISNESGSKLIADFYASSKEENAALSPPTMVATFSALAHLGRGKTKEELQKLLSLNDTENTSFGNLEKYLIQSYGVAIQDKTSADLETIQIQKKINELNAQINKGFDQHGMKFNAMPERRKMLDEIDNFENELQKQQDNEKKKHVSKFGEEYQGLGKELQELETKLEDAFDPVGIPDSGGATYNSTGYLLVNALYGNVSSAMQKEYYEKFGTKVESTDFSEEGVRKFNDAISRTTDGDFGDVIKADEQSIAVCSAMKFYLEWGFIMEKDFERPFNFDKGQKDIPFLKGDFQVRNISVNDKIGYLFPVGLTDMIFVKCRNDADLKQLAKTIAADGIKIESAGTRLRPVGLYIPTVGFQTKFNFAKYAQDKGFSTPFKNGQAEYALSDDISVPYPCSDARVESLFQVDEVGITLKQITVAAIPLPMGRDQRMPEKIIIDSPYLMILTERNLGTILGMAFVANPEFDFD